MLADRTRERDQFLRALAQVQSGSGQGVFLGGEPGMGKSTLLAYLRQAATARRFTIAETVADPGWSLPYAPWTSILDQLGIVSVQLTSAPTPGTSPDDHRHWAQRSVLTALRDAAAREPILVILDDLQWVDPQSRDLLVHILRGVSGAPVMIAGSWRMPLSNRTPGFQAFAANLLREPGATTIVLDGLDREGTAELTSALGWPLSPGDVELLVARTNGNPFFVSELARLAANGGDPLAGDVPPSIRQVVQLRINSLDPRTQQVLRVAAILRSGFDFDVLMALTDLGEDDLLAAIDDALDHDLLRVSDLGSEHYDFAHAIVREAIATGWSPSRRVRLHRRAAESLESRHSGGLDAVAGDLAMHYHASRSLSGANRGIRYALSAAARANAAFDHPQAATFLTIAHDLAANEPIETRAGIDWQRAVALADSLDVDAATAAAEQARTLLQTSGLPPDVVANACWRMAHVLNAVGANAAVRHRLRETGLAALGERRDIHWARLRLLDDPIAVVPDDVLYVTRWAGYDAEARRIALRSPSEEDQVQTIDSFDPRPPADTRALIALARTWGTPRATLRGLTAAANDLTYRHGEYQQAMKLWNEILDLSRRIGAVPWQANALNQITLLHVTFGEFDRAVSSKYEADAANAELGPTADAEVLLMERDFALSHYLDGDWQGQAAFWLQFAGEPPLGLEAQLATPLYAAVAASAAAHACNAPDPALRLVDAALRVSAVEGVQTVNGVVGWAGDAVSRFRATSRAAAIDRLATNLIRMGISDYPQTSLHLTRARMMTLLGNPEAQDQFETSRRTLRAQGQIPLLGIASYEQAMSGLASPEVRRSRLDEAASIFQQLGMTAWHDRAATARSTPATTKPDLLGVSRRELDVLKLVSRGFPDRRIADDLFISERTVHAHMRSMLAKTGAANRTELAHWANEQGIIDREAEVTFHA